MGTVTGLSHRVPLESARRDSILRNRKRSLRTSNTSSLSGSPILSTAYPGPTTTWSSCWRTTVTNRASFGSPTRRARSKPSLRSWEQGGGLFATGDHEDLGAGMCARIPRVRSMRYWKLDDTPSSGGVVAAQSPSGATSSKSARESVSRCPARPHTCRPHTLPAAGWRSRRCRNPGPCRSGWARTVRRTGSDAVRCWPC
jgi:hypothetical protein